MVACVVYAYIYKLTIYKISNIELQVNIWTHNKKGGKEIATKHGKYK